MIHSSPNYTVKQTATKVTEGRQIMSRPGSPETSNLPHWHPGLCQCFWTSSCRIPVVFQWLWSILDAVFMPKKPCLFSFQSLLCSKLEMHLHWWSWVKTSLCHSHHFLVESDKNRSLPSVGPIVNKVEVGSSYFCSACFKNTDHHHRISLNRKLFCDNCILKWTNLQWISWIIVMRFTDVLCYYARNSSFKSFREVF